MRSISGQVVLRETGAGIGGLLVSATAKITARDGAPVRSRRLGSEATSSNGQFTINFDLAAEEFDLTLTVSAPHGSGGEEGAETLASELRRDPSAREVFRIAIPRDKLRAAGVGRRGDDAAAVITGRRAADERRAALVAERRKVVAARLADAKRIRDVAASSFERFMSALSGVDRERGRGRYLPPGADIETAQAQAIRDGVGRDFNRMERGRFATFTEAQLQQLQVQFGPVLSRVPAAAIEALRPGMKRHPAIVAHPADWWCRKQKPLNDCVDVLEAAIAAGDPPDVEPPDEPPPPPPEPTPELPSDVPSLITRLTKTMTSPEEAVLLGVRPSAGDIQGSVDGLALRSGPADVPAVYEFHRLEIAFEPIWQELFDKGAVDTGRQLYEKLVELGLDPNAYLIGPGEELLRKLPKTGAGEEALVEAPPAVTRHFEITQLEWNALDEGHRQELEERLVPDIEAAYSKQKDLAQFLEAITPLLGASATENLRALYTTTIDRSVRAFRAQGARIIKYAKEKLQAPKDWDHFHELLAELDKRLKEPYRFNIYAAGRRSRSVNFGIVLSYRQRWTPTAYQVGELVRTVPLAPKEVRRYSRKLVRKLTRAEKESRSTLESLRTESTTTMRAESEIIAKARTKTNYDIEAKAGMNLGVVNIEGAAKISEETEQSSQDTKREFREAVFKAAQEWREEHKIEVETAETSELTDEESGEISNPNDELTVTYLFYELQRRYRVDEKLHKVQPVVLVAQEFSDNIDEDWIVAHDWILRQHLLHSSFLPALDYLVTKVVGDEHALNEIYASLQQQRRILETLTDELTILRTQVSSRYEALQRSMSSRADAIQAESDEGFLDAGHEFLFGSNDVDPEAVKAREDAARDAYERLARQEKDLTARLESETAAVAKATEVYSNRLSEHLNRRTQISRLRVHIKQNLFHYMQAIYSHEPPDQRYFRLRDVRVPRLVGETTYSIVTDTDAVPLPPTWTKPHKLVGQVAIDAENLEYDNLGDIADLDNLLGFAGNMMIFPLKRDNALTSFLTAPYYDPFTGLQDPDVLGTWTMREFAEHVCCLRRHASRGEFDRYLPGLVETYRRLKERADADDEIIVPTGSLYIEALPGAHPLLEDFKLAHRAIDVKQAQAAARAAELENLRLAARLLEGEREDPSIEKKIVIEGNADVDVDDE